MIGYLTFPCDPISLPSYRLILPDPLTNVLNLTAAADLMEHLRSGHLDTCDSMSILLAVHGWYDRSGSVQPAIGPGLVCRSTRIVFGFGGSGYGLVEGSRGED